jgi:hypothetical protein
VAKGAKSLGHATTAHDSTSHQMHDSRELSEEIPLEIQLISFFISVSLDARRAARFFCRVFLLSMHLYIACNLHFDVKLSRPCSAASMYATCQMGFKFAVASQELALEQPMHGVTQRQLALSLASCMVPRYLTRQDNQV